VHYEEWQHFSEGRDATQTILGDSGLAEIVHWLEPGKRTKFES